MQHYAYVEQLAKRGRVTVAARAAGSKRRAAAGRWEPDGGGRKVDSSAAKTTFAVPDGWRFGATHRLAAKRAAWPTNCILSDNGADLL